MQQAMAKKSESELPYFPPGLEHGKTQPGVGYIAA